MQGFLEQNNISSELEYRQFFNIRRVIQALGGFPTSFGFQYERILRATFPMNGICWSICIIIILLAEKK